MTAPFSTTKRLPESLAAVSEIHPRLNARDVEMLDRGEIKAARRAPAADLDIVGLVAAEGHLIQRQVGNDFKGCLQTGIFVGRRFVASCFNGLAHGDFFAQAFKLGQIATRLCCSGFFGKSVLFGLGRFSNLDCIAPRLVQREQFGRQRCQAPAGKGRVKSGGVFPDGADIVHGSPLAA